MRIPVSAVAVLSTLAAFLLAGPALAQVVPCADRSQLLKHLQTEFNEVPVARGVTSGGTLLEVVTSADGRGWTIILTVPEGPTCLVAAGEDWQRVDPKPLGPTM